MTMDLSIDNSMEGPKILIFHTHSNEMYADSNGNVEDGIWGVGEVLKEYLLKGYAVNCRINAVEQHVGLKLQEHEQRLDRLDEKVDFFVRTSAD